MPLAFPSLNHGTIAFGFFNIDTDLLLLEHYFVFAKDLCSSLSRMAHQSIKGSFETSWDVYSIDRREDIGDLMAAIHGVRFTGFIGKVYKLFPFPRKEEDFKQKPEGCKHREVMEALIGGYGMRRQIAISANAENETITVAEYLFTKEVFQRLVEYLWLGGYPRWRGGVRPCYVLDMKKILEKTAGWLFRGLTLRYS
ncbi:MAG: hypothetical protein JW836_11640 [Deltaproteobacteria bacterium]|nr:hypothetical protein [Deltaproteobacteria bacterium]